MSLTWSAFTDALRHAHGPRARIKRVQRAGVDGVQVLDSEGAVLLQTFTAPRPIDVLRQLTEGA